MRIAWPLAIVPGAVGVALFVYELLTRSELEICTCFSWWNETFTLSSTTMVLICLSLAVVSLAVSVHYLWFYYIAIDDRFVQQSKYFGLVRRSSPTDAITRVGGRPIGLFQTNLFATPNIQFEWGTGMIEINPTFWWKGGDDTRR